MFSKTKNTINCVKHGSFPFSSLSCVQLFVTPWTTSHQACLSITTSQNLLKLMSIESVMPSNHLILCGPLFLLPLVFLSIRVFSNGSALRIRWPKYWSFSFSICSSINIQDWFPLGWTGWISLQSKGLDLHAVEHEKKKLQILSFAIYLDTWYRDIKMMLLIVEEVTLILKFLFT